MDEPPKNEPGNGAERRLALVSRYIRGGVSLLLALGLVVLTYRRPDLWKEIFGTVVVMVFTFYFVDRQISNGKPK